MIDVFGKPIENITVEDLNSLVSSKVTESKKVEYKLALRLSRDSEKKEFLFDVSAFANSEGGAIFFGIKEKEGVAIEVTGMPRESEDDVSLRIESILLSSIRPRVQSYSPKFINIDENRYVLVLYIPLSFTKPHMVIFQGNQRFYARNNSGKYPMDIDQIRDTVFASSNIIERANNLRKKRVTDFLNAHNTFKHNQSLPTLILHVMPLSIFNLNIFIDIKKVTNPREELKLLYMDTYDFRYIFDGILSFFFVDRQNGTGATTLLHREGYIEAIDSTMLEERELGQGTTKEKNIFHSIIEYNLMDKSKKYIQLLYKLELFPPYVIFITFLNINDYKMFTNTLMLFGRRSYSIIEDHLFVPGMLVQSKDDEMSAVLKPAFDSVWNACGYPRSLNFDENGRWNPRK